MADGIGISIEGAGGLLAELEDMSRIGDSPAFRAAMLEAAELVEKNIKEEIPKLVKEHTGQLKEQTKATGKVRKQKGTLIIEVVSEARSTRTKKGKPTRAPYPGFLEYGTENKDGSTRIKARPFMRQGAEKSREAVLELIAKKLF